MRKTLPGAGVQKDNYGGNHREVQRVQQQLSEYFPCKGRRTDRACAVHVWESVFDGKKCSEHNAPSGLVYVYAVETAIQMTLTELNENLREIYIEAYTQKEACEYIQRETAKELYQIFGSYQPELTERDFYELEIGSAGIMRGYMAHPCDAELTLEKKLRLFFTMSLRAYNVPEEEIGRVIRFVEGLDIRAISEQVMQKLFKALAMHYEFSLQGIM